MAVRLVGAVLGGLLLPWMAYRLARRLFPKRQWTPLVTALCTAGYAYFVMFAARIMTETLPTPHPSPSSYGTISV